MKISITRDFDLTDKQILELFLDSIGMKWILNENKIYNLFVVKEDDEYRVCESCGGRDSTIDDRGELFLALCQVIANLYPNTPHRSMKVYENGRRID